MLASDVTDLYLKGDFGRLRPQPHEGALSVTLDAEGETAEVRTTADDFAQVLAAVKEELRDQARGLDRLAAFLGIKPFEGILAPVHTGQPLAMTSDQRQAAAEFLRPQYKAVERTLGRVPDAWHLKG